MASEVAVAVVPVVLHGRFYDYITMPRVDSDPEVEYTLESSRSERRRKRGTAETDEGYANGTSETSENWSCCEPWFQEVGASCPSPLKTKVQQELEKLAENTLHVLGFRGGCFHVELMYMPDGARIIEVNARMGGASVREVNLVAWGVDLIEEHRFGACGIRLSSWY